VLHGRAAEALDELNRVYSAGAELRQVVRGLMESCRDQLITALTKRDRATAQRLSSVLEALLHLDGEVRRHAEPRFLVEATLARLAVELGSPSDDVPAPAAPTPSAVVAVVPAAAPPAPVSAATPPEPRDGDLAAGWTGVLEQLNRTVRAVYREAKPELSGSTLVLWFRYEFHHKKAQEQSAQLLPLVREWLGNKVALDFKLREIGSEGGKPGPRTVASPEDDPFVREVVRRFDGRVTRVKEVTE
jgi:hypothetical protein